MEKFDDFILEDYKAAWKYIIHTYNMSDKMMGYAFSIIAIIIALASKVVINGNAANTCRSIIIFPDPSTNAGESTMLSLIFLGSFLAGLLIHAFIVSQRAIIDREVSRIKEIRNYFLSKPNISEKIRKKLSFDVKQGSKDIIAQLRLSIPIIVNSFSFTLFLIYYKFHLLWGNNYCIIIFVSIGIILYYLINTIFLKYIESSVIGKK